MNSTPEDSALRDRLFVIDVNGYTKTEKKNIILKHTFPNTLKDAGIHEKNIIITAGTAMALVNLISPNKSGVRELESAVKEIVRKLCFLETMGESKYNLPFDLSFKLNVTFPFTIHPKHFNILIDKKESSNPSVDHLYL